MSKARYVVQWDEQPIHLTKVLCTLLESQTLVDLTVNCNSYTIKVHKCVLAANSTYFRDHLQKDMSIDRVVINSIKHIVLKSLIEYMYCGETSIPEEYMDELVDAAKFFCIRGLSSIAPHKLSGDHFDEVPHCNLLNKPPLFFSKNDKKYCFKDKDYALYDMNRRKHAHGKVTDEAHVALAKEEAASRFALEMLKKDINNTSNVFVIDETCTEATVETNLTAQYENSNNVMQIQEYVLQNEIKSDNSEIDGGENDTDINQIISKTKKSSSEEKMAEIANVPMLYKPNDSAYVNVNVSEQILKSLQNTHAITYHVLPANANGDFQQYICNNFGEYSVQIEDPQPESSYEIVNNDTKKPLTFTQLVADTVSSEFNSTYTENADSYDSVITKTEESIPNVSKTEDSKLDSEKILTHNYHEKFGAHLLDLRSRDVLTENISMRKKRGRPPKRKLFERTLENDSLLLGKKSVKPGGEYSVTDIVHSVDNTSVSDLNDRNNKENEYPDVIDQNEDRIVNDSDSNRLMSVMPADQNFESGSNPIKENRRQTRSSFKFP